MRLFNKKEEIDEEEKQGAKLLDENKKQSFFTLVRKNKEIVITGLAGISAIIYGVIKIRQEKKRNDIDLVLLKNFVIACIHASSQMGLDEIDRKEKQKIIIKN